MKCNLVGDNKINCPTSPITKCKWQTNLQELKYPLARCPGLVISTFGLAEIITCMPDRLIKKNISDIDKLVNIRISTCIHICYMLFNQQQCFIYSTARFLAKLRAKKVEKLGSSSSFEI